MDEKLEILLRIGELQSKAGALFVRGESIKASGDWNMAYVAYQEYIAAQRSLLITSLEHNEQFRESPYNIPPIANTLVNALLVGADIAQSIGKRGDTESLRQDALRTSRNHLGRKGTAEAERARAGALTLEGRFNEAITALMGARDLTMERNELLDLTRVTIDLADVLQWLGDFVRAREEITHAEELIEPLLADGTPTQATVGSGLLSDMASIMAGRGDPGNAMERMQLYRASIEVTYFHGLISRAMGDWDDAEHCMETVLPEYGKLGAGESIEFQLAMIKLGKGQYHEALKQMRRIQPVFEMGAYRPKKGVLQRVQAECLFALGETGAALRLLDESVEDLTSTHFDPDALWRAHWLLARLLSATGRADLCLQSLQHAVETINNLRRSPLGFRLDSTFLDDKMDVFLTAVEEAMKANDLRNCCLFMDSIKSRTLSAVLSIPAHTEGQGSGPEREFEEVTRRLDAMEYQAYREGWSSQSKQEHGTLLARRTDLLERIRISDPRWRTLSEPVALDFDELLDSLARRQQAALTIFVADKRIHAVLLIDGELLGDTLDMSENTIQSLNDYAANLQKSKSDFFKYDLSAEFSVEAQHLIPPSLLEEAVSARSLCIVPHGDLHLVPWAGLLHGGKRLFELLPVGVLPNLGMLTKKEEAPRPSGVALIGLTGYGDARRLDDLPSVQDEIEAIADIYDGDQIVGKLLDRDATEARFWSLVDRGVGNVLHMSCHGVIVPNEPMSSGLLLYDSKVDAAEFARGPFQFDEVVLSACSTGWRPTEVDDVILSSDEILGIPGGFLESGASSVLVSIPKAEGKTARDLTVHYHERRVKGESPMFALRSAQRHMLEQVGVKPALWIGFTMYGCR